MANGIYPAVVPRFRKMTSCIEKSVLSCLFPQTRHPIIFWILRTFHVLHQWVETKSAKYPKNSVIDMSHQASENADVDFEKCMLIFI